MIDDRMSVRTLLPLVGYLRTREVDVVSLLGRVAIDPLALFSRDAWVSREATLALWREAQVALPAERLGLSVLAFLDARLVDALNLESGFFVPQLVFASSSVSEAIDRLVRFYPVTHGSSRLGYLPRVEGQPAGTLELGLLLPRDEPRVGPFSEFSLGLVLSLLAAAAAEPFAPLVVRFDHPGPRDDAAHAEYARVFGAEVRFSADHCGAELPEHALHIRLKTRDFLRLELVLAAAEEAERRKAADITTRDRAKAFLATAVRGGDVSIDATAKSVGLSVRHLSRQLLSEGTSHKKLLDEARAARAKTLLLETEHTLDEIVVLLGYSDASAFRRAFRRWYGCAPTELRARASSG